jgi:hypothetical protein
MAGVPGQSSFNSLRQEKYNKINLHKYSMLNKREAKNNGNKKFISIDRGDQAGSYTFFSNLKFGILLEL